MNEIFEGETMDMILKFALEHEGCTVTSTTIRQDLLPELNIDEIKLLLKRIGNTTDEIANVNISDYNALITSTGLTARFLKQGGFTAKERREKVEGNTFREIRELEKELTKSNIAANRLNETNAKWNRTATIINIIIGGINLGIIIWQVV